MPVPSAATTESHPYSSSKSFPGVLLGRYLIKQLAASSFSTASIASQIQETASDILHQERELIEFCQSPSSTLGELSKRHAFTDIVPISASKSDNLDALRKVIVGLLPEAQAMFPVDQVTDRSVSFRIAELIREKRGVQ